jgi:hypothetical protein
VSRRWASVSLTGKITSNGFLARFQTRANKLALMLDSEKKHKILDLRKVATRHSRFGTTVSLSTVYVSPCVWNWLSFDARSRAVVNSIFTARPQWPWTPSSLSTPIRRANTRSRDATYVGFTVFLCRVFFRNSYLGKNRMTLRPRSSSPERQ